jgi:hypothetical protein
MATVLYTSALEDLARGAIDFDTDTFHWMLVGSGYTEDKNAHTKRSQVTNEVSGTGYSAGGQACTVAVMKDASTSRTTITLGAVAWPASTISARKAICYKRRGGAASADELVCCVDFGMTVASNASTFNLAATSFRLQN